MMNEKTIELVLQCYSPYKDFDLEKFTELVVRECAEIAKKAEPFQTYDLILKHFGIR